MAYRVQKIDPLDFQPRKAMGVSLPFSGRAVFNSTYQSKDAIKTNLINYFMTGKGERYLNPEFGNSVRPLLFDQLTENKVRQIDTEVRNDLSLYFPRVVINELKTIGIPDENTVQLYLKYSVESTNIEDEIILNFEQ